MACHHSKGLPQHISASATMYDAACTVATIRHPLVTQPNGPTSQKWKLSQSIQSMTKATWTWQIVMPERQHSPWQHKNSKCETIKSIPLCGWLLNLHTSQGFSNRMLRSSPFLKRTVSLSRAPINTNSNEAIDANTTAPINTNDKATISAITWAPVDKNRNADKNAKNDPLKKETMFTFFWLLLTRWILRYFLPCTSCTSIVSLFLSCRIAWRVMYY